MFDQAPNNLPIEPEDILAGGEQTPAAPVASSPSSAAPAVDTAGTPPSALATGRLRPAAPVASSDFLSGTGSLPPTTRNAASPAPEDMQSDSDVEISPPLLNKRNLFILAVAALLILIAGGAFWVWRSSKNRATPAPQNEASAPTAPSVNGNAPVAPAPVAATTTEPAVPQPLSPAIDSDGDGLTDQQEIQYGTDPQKADTDGDGLTDYEEIFIWHTNPLNPDTDGDGFSDGQEVKNGYNPNGSGRLLNIPTAATSSSASSAGAPAANPVKKP